MSKKESASRLIPFYNMICSRKVSTGCGYFLLISALQAKNRNSAQDLRPVRCTFQHYLPWAIPPSRGGTIGNVGASDPNLLKRGERINEWSVCGLFPQALSLHIVDVLVAVGCINDLRAGVDEGVDLLALERLDSRLDCLVAHVVAELSDIHAERTVLDGGDSGGIAVKAVHDGIGIRLLSININAEKLHFRNKKCSFHGGDREI